MTNLNGRTVVLTGANGGFGQAFMRQLLERRCNLIVSDLDAEALSREAERICAEVGRGTIVGAVACDLSMPDGADALFAGVNAFGRNPDVLINNAGIGLMGRHDEVPAVAWERLMQVNLLAPMRLSALFTPAMVERGSGHIVNVCSLAAWMSDVGLTAYSASKFGLRGFSDALADELNKHGIQVSAVHPFYSNTAILDSPRYGTLAVERATEVDRSRLSDPADIIRNTLKAVEQGQRHIFPDRIGRIAYRMQRYTPAIFNRIKSRLSGTN